MSELSQIKNTFDEKKTEVLVSNIILRDLK